MTQEDARAAAGGCSLPASLLKVRPLHCSGGCSASPLLHQPLPVSASFHRVQFSAGLRHVSLGGCCTPEHPEQHGLKLLLSREPGSCYSPGSLQTPDLQCSPRNTSARWQGWQITVGRESRSLEWSSPARAGTRESAAWPAMATCVSEDLGYTFGRACVQSQTQMTAMASVSSPPRFESKARFCWLKA